MLWKNPGNSRRGILTPFKIKLLFSLIKNESKAVSNTSFLFASSEIWIAKTGSFKPSIPRTASSFPDHEKRRSSRVVPRSDLAKPFAVFHTPLMFVSASIIGKKASFN